MRKIDHILCAIADNAPEGDRGAEEGIAAGLIGDAWMPLFSTSPRTVDSVRAMAQHVANVTGKELRLVKFTRAETLDVIKPGSVEGADAPPTH